MPRCFSFPSLRSKDLSYYRVTEPSAIMNPAPGSTSTGRPFIPAMTGLRAICAYGIFFYHLNFFSKDQSPDGYRFVDQFYSFIPFFFVISGFVICYTYYRDAAYDRRQWRNYFVSRVARIFPLLIMLNIFVFALSCREGLYNAAQSVKLFLLNITLLKGFSSDYLLTGVGPSWTNSVEEVFYLLAPVFFILTRRKYFFLAALACCYAAGVLITVIFDRLSFEGFFSSFTFTAYFTFFGRIFEFLCGMYLALLYLGIKKNPFPAAWNRWSMPAGVLIIIAAFLLQYYIAGAYHVEHANEVWPGILVNNFFLPAGIFLLLYGLLYSPGWLGRFLSSGIMVQLGNATYSFYLLHTTFVLSYIHKYISSNLAVTFICMVIIAFLVYKCVEQPLARLVKKTFSVKPLPAKG